MAPFIPDGVYKIRNVEFKESVVALLYGNPTAPIVGVQEREGDIDQEWVVTNIGSGGDQIAIQSVRTGSFASAQQFLGANLVGSSDKKTWTVVKVDNGYYLQSSSANLVWELTAPFDNALIVLYHTAEDNTKWEFVPVN